MRKVAITTEDNPFNPFDQFDLWFHFDTSQGYNSSGLIARVAGITDSLSDADNNRAVEDAIDLIIEVNPTGKHKKLVMSE